jgi:release factor glutamine methyltransferase
VTAAALLEEAAAALAAAGVPDARWDAERLLRHVLGWDRAALVAGPDHPVAPADAARVRALVARRASREPLQHILGVQAFWKHEFLVTPAVLVPRPDTEVLVETALRLIEGVRRPVVVDVGTGSGCIALSIAAERPDAVVHATDVSPSALEVAVANGRRLGLEGRVAFHLGHLLEPLSGPERRGLEPSLVVSNPPYVDPAECDTLAPEVRDHEPALALFPPGDALSVYRALAPAAAGLLASGGALAVEIGPALAPAVREILGSAGFEGVAVVPDLAGRPRVVSGRLPLG